MVWENAIALETRADRSEFILNLFNKPEVKHLADFIRIESGLEYPWFRPFLNFFSAFPW